LFVSASEEFVQGVGANVPRWFPIWQPQYPRAHTYNASKATRAELRRRPLSETVEDTLAWDEERRRPELRAGVPFNEERDLVAAWRKLRPG
jgi:hypothetical protein